MEMSWECVMTRGFYRKTVILDPEFKAVFLIWDYKMTKQGLYRLVVLADPGFSGKRGLWKEFFCIEKNIELCKLKNRISLIFTGYSGSEK